jgi:hypothetical protein
VNKPGSGSLNSPAHGSLSWETRSGTAVSHFLAASRRFGAGAQTRSPFVDAGKTRMSAQIGSNNGKNRCLYGVAQQGATPS